MSDTSQRNSHIQIRILPSPEEDDDMETLGMVEDVRQDFLTDVSHNATFTVKVVGTQTRNAGPIVLVLDFLHGVIAQKDLIMQLFQTSKFAINALSKRGHVKAIEMTIDGDSIRIEDANYAQADRLISIFEAKYPGKVQQITPSSIIEVVGTISKVKQSVIEERPTTGK